MLRYSPTILVAFIVLFVGFAPSLFPYSELNAAARQAPVLAQIHIIIEILTLLLFAIFGPGIIVGLVSIFIVFAVLVYITYLINRKLVRRAIKS